MGAYSLYVRNEISDQKNIYQYIAKDKADHIATTVNNVLIRAEVLNALIKDHDGDTGHASRGQFGRIDKAYDTYGKNKRPA